MRLLPAWPAEVFDESVHISDKRQLEDAEHALRRVRDSSRARSFVTPDVEFQQLKSTYAA
jgi:hypothetical protein